MFNYTAFDNFNLIAQGSLDEVALDVRKRIKSHRDARILIFSDFSGKQMDLDLSGTEKEVLERLKIFKNQETETANPGPGRPKLGVVAREISLRPTHWEWLSNQPGGASATIRHLVDEKMKSNTSPKMKVKQAQETVYKFLHAIAGDLPNYEEALRFLYRKDEKKFRGLILKWPEDIVKHTLTLAEDVFNEDAK
ncbi:MAG: DUF2239 family protein [Bdellovibrionaceae bacterium]|nr:DUF2239 family protein [Pseudobdellovibrionaceae bacterium]